jgi:hypothetical protein
MSRCRHCGEVEIVVRHAPEEYAALEAERDALKAELEKTDKLRALDRLRARISSAVKHMPSLAEHFYGGADEDR